ncbi:MAG: phosphonate C-P lyase system protein PhnH [Bilophila wadsworthia]
MPAFSQPVFDMQRVFRVVLDAMSRPARLCRLPVFPQSVPDGLSPVLAALALTLCDGESPLWLSPGLRKDETTTWLRFHCGCPIVEEADKAAFALVADASELPPLSAFAQGVLAFPRPFRNRLACRSVLMREPVSWFRPGICGVPSPARCPKILRSGGGEYAGFPLGVDMLCGADGVAGLPRTTRLERLPQECVMYVAVKGGEKATSAAHEPPPEGRGDPPSPIWGSNS